MAAENIGLLTHSIRLALGGIMLMPGLSPGQDQDTAQLERLTVTGSHIKRVDIESASPLLVIHREGIERAGLTSLGTLLQDLPIAGAATNTQFNNGGNGQTHLDLRNLGAQRVLVLMNGRRFVSGLGGIVDLNNIPVAIIKRIEILKDGASSVYGSDAITGVVNVITRDDYKGLQANAYLGQYDAHNDGEIQAYDFSVGTTSDRGSVFFNASYVKAEPVFAADRLIAAEPLFGTGTAFGSGFTPQGRFGAQALGSFRLTTDPGANVTGPGGLGADAFRPGDFSFGTPGSGADRFNFAPDNYMLTPQERTNVFTQGAYDVIDHIRMTLEASYNQRRSAQELAPTPLLLGIFVGSSQLGGRTGIAADNRYNPFGIDLNPSSFLLGRRMVEAGSRIFRQDVDSYRFGLGLAGSFQMLGRPFDWGINYVYAELDQTNLATGQINVARVAQALSGQPCRDDAYNDGCVELNLFGGQGPDGSGTITRDMLDYILYTENSSQGNGLRGYSAVVTGDLIELPAGPLGFATGYEYRQEEGFDLPDSLASTGVTTGRADQPISGSYSVDEFYLEFSVPLLSGITGAERLDLSLSARYSDYDTFGDTTNAKVGIEWQPLDDLLLRATWSEGFRAPPIADLFLSDSDNTVFIFDPCNGIDTDNDGIPDANPGHPGCGGIPGSHEQIGPLDTSVGANPALQPETSLSVTAGFVYSPDWLDGLDITLDYYNVELDDAITEYRAQAIANLCAYTGTVFCGFVTRDPNTGAITDILAAPGNIGGSEIEGADLHLSYSFPESGWGFFRLAWNTSYQGTNEDRVANPATGEIEVISNIGLDEGDRAFARFKSHLDLNWSRGNWEGAWGLEYIHGSAELCTVSSEFGLCNLDLDGDGDPSDGRRIGGTTYHDAQLSYFVSEWDARLTLGVQNVFAKGPPLSTQAFSDSYNRADYRVPGRFPYVRVTVDF